MSALRDFDLREDRPARLVEALKNMWPEAMDSKLDDRRIQTLKKLYKAGVPIDYLESRWADYQADDRDALESARAFARHLPFHVETGGGLVLIGDNGSGKSFLSYMIAITAISAYRLPILCFSVREWVDRKIYQRHNPRLFDELLRMLDQAALVIVDNLSREGEKLGWGPEDVFEIVDRITAGGGRKRALVLNTNMTKSDYEKQAGTSVLSRTKGFERVKLGNKDFRGTPANVGRLIQYRRSGVDAHCFQALSFLDLTVDEVPSVRPTTLPGACKFCCYSTRARLCEIRTIGKWRPLDEPV